MPWDAIAAPLAMAEDSLARLDERLRGGELRAGWIARSHVTDTTACFWLAGELVQLEDLVLRDAGMDVRTPTAVLAKAHGVLAVRRRIAGAQADWALTPQGLDALRGKGAGNEPSRPPARPATGGAGAPPEPDPTDPLAAELASVDAALARSDRALAEIAGKHRQARDPLVYDLDWNEDERLGEWLAAVDRTRHLPPVLAAALASMAWTAIQPLQHQPWLGRLLTASLLRARGKARAHLPCLSTGLRALPRDRRGPKTFAERLVQEIGAISTAGRAGLKECDRLHLARLQFNARLTDRRSTSRLPDMIEHVLGTPLVTARTVAKALKITSRAALDLIAELGLREITGRGRYRAWGLL